MLRSLTCSAALCLTLVGPTLAHAGKVPEAKADDRPGPGPVTPESAHYDLELLYGEGKIDEGLAEARRQLEADPSDPELYRHVVRFLFEKGELIKRDDTSVDKIALYEEMYDLCNKALELDPGNPHLLFNRGIALGRLSTTRGVLSSLFNIKNVEQDWLASAQAPYRYLALSDAEELPCDTYLTLGIFYRIVPDSWVVGALAGTRGDLDKSLAWLEKADACSPNRIRTVKELGVAQLCIGTTRDQPEMIVKGQTTLSRMMGLPGQHTHTHLDKQHGAMLIKDPSLACEYSRDGQQDLDESKLEKDHKTGG